jgi:hypothetical protein
MSNQKNTGGPAFPRIGHVHPYDIEAEQWIHGQEGMTLRDYFAAKAMQGILSCQWVDVSDIGTISHRSYMWADAMLKAREQ